MDRGRRHFFADKNLKNEPKRFKGRKKKRAARPAGGGGMARERVETTTNCSSCGKETTVPFRPTQGRLSVLPECFQHGSSPASDPGPIVIPKIEKATPSAWPFLLRAGDVDLRTRVSRRCDPLCLTPSRTILAFLRCSARSPAQSRRRSSGGRRWRPWGPGGLPAVALVTLRGEAHREASELIATLRVAALDDDPARSGRRDHPHFVKPGDRVTQVRRLQINAATSRRRSKSTKPAVQGSADVEYWRDQVKRLESPSSTGRRHQQAGVPAGAELAAHGRSSLPGWMGRRGKGAAEQLYRVKHRSPGWWGTSRSGKVIA